MTTAGAVYLSVELILLQRGEAAKAEIAALAVSARRAIGQLTRPARGSKAAKS